MSKFSKIFAAVEPLAKPFVPGAAGTLLDMVTKGIEAHSGSPAPATADALKALATDNDEQTRAILALHERMKVLETKLGI